MFHLHAFLVVSLLVFALGAIAWTHRTWLNTFIKLALGVMAVWALILVLQVFVPMGG